MRKILFPALSLMVVLIAAQLIISCSDDLEGNSEKTESIETQTAKIGHEAAEAIKVPMENAQDAVDMENERMREYEKRLNE